MLTGHKVFLLVKLQFYERVVLVKDRPIDSVCRLSGLSCRMNISFVGMTTTCYAVALNPRNAGVSGEYFSDSNIAKPLSLA